MDLNFKVLNFPCFGKWFVLNVDFIVFPFLFIYFHVIFLRDVKSTLILLHSWAKLNNFKTFFFLRYFVPYLHWIKGMNTNGNKSIF